MEQRASHNEAASRQQSLRHNSTESCEAEYIEYRKKRNILCFGYSPHTLDKLLSQILPIAEFMLLIIVLVMFLQVQFPVPLCQHIRV